MRRFSDWAKDKPAAMRAYAVVWLCLLPVLFVVQSCIVVYREVVLDMPGALKHLWRVLKTGKPL